MFDYILHTKKKVDMTIFLLLKIFFTLEIMDK